MPAVPRVLIIIVCTTVSWAADGTTVSCAFPDSQEQSMVQAQNCGSVDNQGLFHLSQTILNRTLFSKNKPACYIVITGQSEFEAYYVLSSGKNRSTLFIDNGCDYFKEGLARARVNGKIVYFDKTLTDAIKTSFEEGAPFDYGHAAVCDGPFVNQTVGEHVLESGGQCGLIDRDGKLVVPADFKMEERDVFTRYIDSHNECIPPPIKTKSDALCHGRRHARAQDYLSDDWTWYTVVEEDDVWLIQFIQSDDTAYRMTISIDTESAAWNSIIPEVLKINHSKD